MPMSPYEVQNIMASIDALQKMEAQGKTPPGSTEAALQGLRNRFEFSGKSVGDSANEGFTGRWTGEEPVRAPWRGEYDMPGNFERSQNMADSLAEDAMLRESMKYSYRLPKGDETPPGTYALARYPGIEHDIWAQEAGFAPKGMQNPMYRSPQQQQAEMAGRKRWAEHQRKLLGMGRPIDAREWRKFNRGMKGSGAKERSRAFRRFLAGFGG